MIFLAFIVPLAIYLQILAYLNRRQHPTLVSGTWDFVGVLFAASGFILLGGPAILTGLYEDWRISWLLGQTRYLQGLGESWNFWVSLWMLYFAVVVGVATLALRRRKNLTSIYNVEPAIFADVLAQLLERLGLEWRRQTARRLLIRTRADAGGQALGALGPLDDPAPGQHETSVSTRWIVLDLDPFEFMRHVSLRWGEDADELRMEIEHELSKILPEVPSGRNPIGNWFFSIATGLFITTFFGVFAFLLPRILEFIRW